MYILIFLNTETKLKEYHGPFGTVERAHEYAKSHPDFGKKHFAIHTEPLNVPYNIVKQIVWRSNDN